MNNIRRIQYFLFCLLAIGLASCSDDDNNDKKTGYEGILTELARSEERRVGKECRSRWSPYH